MSHSATLHTKDGKSYVVGKKMFSRRHFSHYFELVDHSDAAAVVFSDNTTPPLLSLQKLCLTNINTANIFWPTSVLYDEDEVYCGYLTNFPQPYDYTQSLEDLLFKQSIPDGSSPASLRIRLKIATKIVSIFASLHKMGHLVKAFDASVFFVNQEGNVLYAGADMHCGSNSLTEQELLYLAPELFLLGIPNCQYTVDSDHFILSVILFQLFTGIHPFVINPKGLMDQKAICDNICDGRSVYFDATLPVYSFAESKLQVYSEEINEAFRLAFDYCGRQMYTAGRPTVKDWQSLLADALMTVGDMTLYLEYGL